MTCGTFTITDSTGFILFPKPYPGNISNDESYSTKKFAFQEGRFYVYIEEKSNDGIVIKGFCIATTYKTCHPICFDDVFGTFCFSSSDLSQKFDFLNDAMDAEREVTISGLSDEIDAVYVIENFSYNIIPHSVDAFEYNITLKYVRGSE